MITTYSMWRMFRDCRMACKLRYFDHLSPIERDSNLAFGAVIHDCLELHHGGKGLSAVMSHIDSAYPHRWHDAKQKSSWHMAGAMMVKYSEYYRAEPFEVIVLEKTFEGQIINPATGATSRSFTLAGKVDGIIKMDGAYWLLEHKTASSIDAGYLERLWTDFQITIYSWYVEQTMGLEIAGVIYNILGKAKLRQGQGETESEYETRKTELIAKSKTGKSSAKRKMEEPDGDFHRRMLAKYEEPDMFHREQIFISRDQHAELQAELWELTQVLLDAKRRNAWYKNTSQCFNYNRLCDYYPICRSGGNQLVIENQYQKIEPNQELATEPAVF